MLVVGIENGERVKGMQQVDCAHTYTLAKEDGYSFILWDYVKTFYRHIYKRNILLRTKTLKSALSCIRKTDQLFLYVPLIFCTSQRQHDFLLSYPLP